MDDDAILLLGGDDVRALLAGREREVAAAVRDAYLTHARGASALPHSTFLRFPGDRVNRIIGLPAFLGDGFGVAGIKWISSFPGNVGRGMARASAVLVLNRVDTGRPRAILEGSLISAWRTAASAALAARELHGDRAAEPVGLIGAGLINFEVARFLRVLLPAARLVVYDLDPARAEAFARRAAETWGEEPRLASGSAEVLAESPLVSFATTAVEPHVESLDGCRPGATLLHVSLRDLSAAAILAADNVVDDPDHVCRAQTSVHLAEQRAGGRGFIRCTLADLLAGSARPKPDPDAVTVFSPFGLGVLDLAVGELVRSLAAAAGRGTTIHGFFGA